MIPTILDLESLRRLYTEGGLTPHDVVDAIVARLASADPAAFITRMEPAALRAAAAALLRRAPVPNSLPLWGVPFAVKDNIDVAGLPTTAGCPQFAYQPATDAAVVARLLEAGALVIGKTNLDQFATGLNGTRSPYGAPRSVFNPDYIAGGSSSGSAVAVAAGLASFALGTDTAGSGRVPAAFNNLVGIKPTPGLLSTSGLVPACRSLDCITVFAATVGDGIAVRRIAEGFDPADPYSRHAQAAPSPPLAGLRLGVLDMAQREFFGDGETERLYDAAIDRARALGCRIVTIDYTPFGEAAALLYQGPWVAERLAAISGLLETQPEALDPTVRGVIEGGRGFSAVDAFRGQYALAALRRQTEAQWAAVHMLLLPTAPTTYTVSAMQADPVALNSRLGRYTNFANLLDCSAIAVPAGFRADGLPAGVTLVGRAFHDDALAELADLLHRGAGAGMGVDRGAMVPEASRIAADAGAADERLALAVVGAHLSGMALNGELTRSGGICLRQGRTATDYRLFVVPGTTPAKPGLIRQPGFDGPGIAVEIWSLDPAAFGRFVESIPAPLGIGKITLADGDTVSGFLAEPHAVMGGTEITEFGGWRAYMQARRSQDRLTETGAGRDNDV